MYCPASLVDAGELDGWVIFEADPTSQVAGDACRELTQENQVTSTLYWSNYKLQYVTYGEFAFSKSGSTTTGKCRQSERSKLRNANTYRIRE